MVSFNTFISSTYWNNTGQDYLIALGIFVVLFFIFKIFDSLIIAYLKKQAAKTKITWDDIIIDFINAIHWQFYAYVAFYIATKRLTIILAVEKILLVILTIFIAFYIGQGLSRVVDHLTNAQIEKRKKSDNAQNTSMIKVFGTIFKIVIWVLILLTFLSNMGIEITPLIASLGVGGIAIAIALQSVLADLFAAFAIYFDKPFKEGDFIIVGSDMGVVNKIGIKTTRITTLQGQELVISNSELTNSRVNNYKKMQRRRIAFSFGVTYDTPSSKMKKINKIVKNIIVKTKDATFDRVHFKEFGNFSLNYEVVYYVETSDYNKYMDIQEEINLGIKEAFEKEGIEFAFPTQTLHIEK
ncbi:mechanosensitive ion channel family protein [Candidatus Pacearchaeota archaeon]|nr:mechanosensitive ion channel family protein [Candidatus Pacearchaeota archaeon]